MSLITPEFLQSVFAASGDTVQLPQTDPAGFVNYKDGYTSAYEINLNANNPQAKAVERPIQNYLFKMLSTNAMAWQRMGFPAWVGAAGGNQIGYDKNAFVLRVVASGESAIFRSLVNNNLSDPLNTPSAWELQTTIADTLSRIPMPLGGTAGPSFSVITTAVDFNDFATRAFVRVGNDGIAASCANLPVYPGGVAAAGVLEVSDWSYLANSLIFQRFTDRLGNVAVRTCLNGIWPAWSFSPNLKQVQVGRQNFLTISSTDGLSYTGNLTPFPDIVDGLEIRAFVAGAPVKAGATLNLNGSSVNAIYGTSGAPIADLEFRVRSSLTLRYSSTIGGWVLIAVSSGMPTGRAVTGATQLVTGGQVQSGNMNYTADTLSRTSPNAYGGDYTPAIQGPTPGMVVKLLASTANTSATPTFRVGSGAADLPIRDVAGGQLIPGIIQPGAILELTYLVAGNMWLLTQATGTGAASAVPVGGVIMVTTPTVPPGYLELDGSLQKIALLPQLYATIGKYYNVGGDPADSFRLPPTRGYFIRGADNGAGVDPGRTVGSGQASNNLQHTHDGTTATAGTHFHVASADPGGVHNHGASSTPVGDHTHGVGTIYGYNNGGGNAVNSGVVASSTTPNTSPGGAHNHTISIDAGGQHAHNVSMGNAGDHQHSFTTQFSGGNESRPINIAFMYCIKAFDVPVNQGTIDVAVLYQQVLAMKRMVPGEQKFTQPGQFTFTVPADAKPDSVFEVQCWGGGASGSFDSVSGNGAAGGGSGAYGTCRIVGLAAGATIGIQVGAGGAKVPAGGIPVNGNAGESSIFGSYLACVGGTVGNRVATGGWTPGRGGGSVTGSLVNYATIGNHGGGASPGAFICGNGGAAPFGGAGGVGAYGGQTDAGAGYQPGGGGGGSAAGSGGGSGAGAQGAVWIKWY